MKWLLMVSLLLLLLSGCSQDKPIPVKAVDWIHVDGESFHGEDNRYFYMPESLEKLLLAVRDSGQTTNPKQDPDALESPEFCITMAYTDGQLERMYVKGDRFIRSEDGHWRQADPERLASLHYLLHFQPGDPVA